MSNRYVSCPNCSKEYALGEIFIPNSLVGQPKFIHRDVEGKIIDCVDNSDSVETYICDCGCQFEVSAQISIKVSAINNIDFDNDYTTKIEPKLNLSET